MKNFNNLRTTKKGTAAELLLINEFVLSKGYVPITPSVPMAHPWDAAGVSYATGEVDWLLDVKCKERLRSYPTIGIDTADLEKYSTYTKPMYILFADTLSGEVYGNWLCKLQPVETYARTTTFALSAMTHYRYLSVDELKYLKENG